MTINSMNVNSSTPVSGLGTQTFNVVTTGLYTCRVKYFIPYQASGSSGYSTDTTGGSSLQVLVKQNATTVLTLSGPSPYQPLMGGSVVIQATAGDTITVVPSSAAAVDNAPNAIKGIINLFQGE